MTAKGLGKGFGSLLPDNFDTSVMLDKGERVQKILINDISPDPNQPRRTFDATAIEELAQSVKRYGILQPLVVTEAENGYTIIAGERRYRAAKKAGLTHVPALVRTLEELERLEIGLIENMQRVDLTPLEQALSIARLNEQFNMDLHDIASRLGKAHTTVVNTVRLLQLPKFASEALALGKISEGHARAVLALKDNETSQRELVNHIIKDGWSVRQAEAYVKNHKEHSENKVFNTRTTIVHPAAKKLEKKYGGRVKISERKRGVSIQFSFKTNKEFTQFLKVLDD
jgi:ParB family transcriptional regulator, chromosome partitioning protein